MTSGLLPGKSHETPVWLEECGHVAAGLLGLGEARMWALQAGLRREWCVESRRFLGASVRY